jgi:hypothetical protein
MTDGPPPLLGDYHRLCFSCACCSAVPIAEDPWVAIVNQRKLNDGTKELILNAIYRQPRTITPLPNSSASLLRQCTGTPAKC